MKTIIAADRSSMGRWVAEQAADYLRQKLQQQDECRIVIATGSSQFEVLDSLAKQSGIDWNRVSGFHLDEYIGISADHPASFCKYLRERFVNKVPLKDFHYLSGDQPPDQTIAVASEKIAESPIDLALVGIGENGHLAFNDPPADFQTQQPYLRVKLDQACRQQQVGEGWFASIDEVPTEAISMSVHQIMQSKRIYCSVPDQRKAVAVASTIQGDVTPEVPASILQNHDDAYLVVDQAAASELSSDSTSQADQV